MKGTEGIGVTAMVTVMLSAEYEVYFCTFLVPAHPSEGQLVSLFFIVLFQFVCTTAFNLTAEIRPVFTF